MAEFQVPTKEEIAARIKASIANPVSTAEGTFSADVSSATSIEFQKAYAELALALEAGFAVTSWGDWLTKRCAELGVDRKAATCAHGVVQVSGTAGAAVIKGSLFGTETGTRFLTTADAVVGADGKASVPVIAAEPGKSGVVGIGAIVKVPMSIPGVTAVSNASETYDGFDAENDESLLERYLLKVRTPATSGNKYHYIQWAREVAGVGRANAIPIWAGNGTVKVIIVNANGESASNDLVAAVAAHIEENRPVGAQVTVVAAVPKKIKITASVRRMAGVTMVDVQTFFAAKLDEMFRSDTFKTNVVSIGKTASLLMASPGVSDYEYGSLNLNGASTNVQIGTDELPVAEVVLSDSQ